MFVSVIAIERSVWTYTASGEICFELAYVPDEALSIPVEDLTVPVYEEIKSEETLDLIADELNGTEDELTSYVDELDYVDYEESVEHTEVGGVIQRMRYTC